MANKTAGTVTKTPLPAGTLVAQVFPHINYSDAYRVPIPAQVSPDVVSVTTAIFATQPRWLGALLWLRNRLVRIVGLKADTHDPQTTPTYEPGSRAGIFRVYQHTADEILMGEDDRHLDFRVSVFVQQGQENWATISTVVRYNGWLGRVYFFFVRPFHQLIVRSLAQNLLRKR